MNSFESFKYFITNDSSPTLEWNGEKMHSWQGAFSESLYIYGQALMAALELGFEPIVLSLGLGLGYNEWISYLIAEKKYKKNLHMNSFEISKELRQAFLNLIRQTSSPTPYDSVFKEVLDVCCLKFQVDSDQVRQGLLELYQKERFILNEELLMSTRAPLKSQVVFFDAFSSRSTPELWTQEFLEYFLKEFCHESCVFTTYAATGILKRALAKAGFTNIARPGYLGKRESTLAIRGVSEDLFKKVLHSLP